MTGTSELPAPASRYLSAARAGRHSPCLTPRAECNVFLSIPCLIMFSIFSKSKAVDSSQTDLSRVPRDVRSCVSVSASKEYKRERKKSRSRNFRGLFSSDCEDEITSVVSDNPQLYHSHKSCSMVSMTGHSGSHNDHQLSPFLEHARYIYQQDQQETSSYVQKDV